MLQCQFKSITLPKFGNTVDENEDNLLEPSKPEIESNFLVQFAISDGATESSFSKEWSDLLVSAYKNKPFDKEHLPITVKIISERWKSIATAIEMPWYAEQKAEKGAFATFLGLTVNREDNTFETVAIGDCALFQIRDDELIFTFPISSIEDFNNTPNLIASNEMYQTDFEKNAIYSNGTIQSKDIMFLATDALAALILKQSKIWKHLKMMFEKKDEDHFKNWLNKLRKANKIKNDDVTLLMIKFE